MKLGFDPIIPSCIVLVKKKKQELSLSESFYFAPITN